MSDYGKQSFLGWTWGKAAMPALVTPVFLALFTTIPTDSNTGGVEPAGNGYARVAIPASSANAAAGSDPSTISNSANLNFPAATGGGWGTIIGMGLFDNNVGGNLLGADYLGNFQWQPCFISNAGPAVFSCKAHGFSNGDNVVYTAKYMGIAPTFSQSNLTGLLVAATVATDSFTVTNGGTAVNTSSTGSGAVRKVVTQLIPGGVTVSFPGGASGQLVQQDV